MSWFEIVTLLGLLPSLLMSLAVLSFVATQVSRALVAPPKGWTAPRRALVPARISRLPTRDR